MKVQLQNNKSIMMTIALMLAAFTLLTQTTSANARTYEHGRLVNGHTVKYVKHGNRGKFVKTGRHRWTEYGKRGAIFTFTERNRDEWSVYLHDRSRNVNLQLDLHRKKVIYSVGNGRRSDLYNIIKVSNYKRPHHKKRIVINGYSVKYVKHANAGKFVQTGRHRWTEYGKRGAIFTFTERNRDKWSVYLHDSSRNVNIQLDLYRKKVIYSVGHGRRSDLYNIIKVSNRYKPLRVSKYNKPHRKKRIVIDGHSVKYVKHANAGKFVQTGRHRWTEYGKRGAIFTFTERNRDKWSVYLHDSSRNVNIQLDLYRKKVIYSVGHGRRSDLYNIIHSR